MLPKVTIIIPFKEDRGFLQSAIDSVNKQNYQGEIELILSQSNKGVSYNINRGIEQASGEYIKYLCDDDWLTPNSIKDSVEYMKGHDFIHGAAWNVKPGLRELQKPKFEKPTFEQMLNNNVIHGGTLMYRKDVFDRIGLFDETLDCAEEYEFNLRCLYNGMKLNYSPYLLYNYRRHDKQKSLGKGINQDLRQKKIKAIKDKFR